MKALLQFISANFHGTLLLLFWLSSLFLLSSDSQELMQKGLIREYKLTRFIGYLYIGLGFVTFVLGMLVTE